MAEKYRTYSLEISAEGAEGTELLYDVTLPNTEYEVLFRKVFSVTDSLSAPVIELPSVDLVWVETTAPMNLSFDGTLRRIDTILVHDWSGGSAVLIPYKHQDDCMVTITALSKVVDPIPLTGFSAGFGGGYS